MQPSYHSPTAKSPPFILPYKNDHLNLVHHQNGLGPGSPKSNF